MSNDRLQTWRLLTELRSRLIYSIFLFVILFFGALFFSNQLYNCLAQPLLKFLPQSHLIATRVLSPFFVPVKLAFTAALLIGIPFFLYQLWAFVSPALYRQEKKNDLAVIIFKYFFILWRNFICVFRYFPYVISCAR